MSKLCLIGNTNVPIIESKARSLKYKNEYYLYYDKEYAELHMTRLSDGYKTIAYIDIDDVDKCLEHSWYPHWDSSKPKHMIYVYSTNMKLHRFLTNCPKDKVIDHVDRNPLNNRRFNLKICTPNENNKNIGISKNNSSGVTGVSFNKRKQRWVGYKDIDGIKYSKKFKTFEEAVNYRKYLDTL